MRRCHVEVVRDHVGRKDRVTETQNVILLAPSFCERSDDLPLGEFVCSCIRRFELGNVFVTLVVHNTIFLLITAMLTAVEAKHKS
jgi:hypothetical protein